jgi:hypothetical protein
MFREALDRAALAGRVAALEQHDDLLARLLDPFLNLEQLDLELGLRLFVSRAPHLGLVRIVPGLEGVPDRFGIMAQLGEPVLRRVVAAIASVAAT